MLVLIPHPKSASWWLRIHRYVLLNFTSGNPLSFSDASEMQIPDWHSYADVHWFFRDIWEAIVNNYAKKTWRMVLNRHQPEHVIFCKLCRHRATRKSRSVDALPVGDLLDAAIYNTEVSECVSALHCIQVNS